MSAVPEAAPSSLPIRPAGGYNTFTMPSRPATASVPPAFAAAFSFTLRRFRPAHWQRCRKVLDSKTAFSYHHRILAPVPLPSVPGIELTTRMDTPLKMTRIPLSSLPNKCMPRRPLHRLPSLAGLLLAVMLCGCSGLVASATRDLTDNLAMAILESDDPETVEAGAPSYLLLIDSLVIGDPDNPDLLRTAADLHTAYADVFVDEPERALKMTRRGRGYALRAACLGIPGGCDLNTIPFERFTGWLQGTGKDHLPTLFSLGAAWATWLQKRTDDWEAVAELPRVAAIMERVVELDETYKSGSAHLYLGVIATLLPPAMGGQPEKGRRHFERAATLSGNRNLSAGVLLAEKYARSVFDRELHDRVLGEVLASPSAFPGFTLANELARRRAAMLLDESADYFE